ncbi:hypothetical protein N510_003429 [Firmicutes bacterium ASF500]|nr:hypothetical protein N510_003429 [Firmicutes bacterium ASF500]
MDYFGLCLDGLCLLGQCVMHIAFVSRLTGKKQKMWHFVIYFFLLCTIQWFFTTFDFHDVLPIGAELLVLYSVSRLALRNRQSVSWAAAILAVYISQLSFGIVNSVEVMLFPRMIGKPLLYLLVLLATLTVFAICACCCGAVLKFLSLTEERQTPYVGLLLFPGLFFFAAELYILQTSYSILPASISLGEAGKHGALFVMQILGLAALLCTLYAYQHICHGFQTQAALRSLEQATQAQKNYIAEAQRRYEQTKAFRHDIANHLSVLDGLLNSKKLDESKAYLQKLKMASTSLSFPYQTGNPVVDILLSEKLGLAKEITAEVTLLLPRPCGIDDFDLCVIFANALDNAINACQSAKGTKLIRIHGERQGDFYMLAFENTCSDEPLPPAGTGLSNIKSVAEKYHGATLTEKVGQRFSLNVLLNISLHPENISEQTY